MVVEALFKGKQVIRKPYLMLLFGLIVSWCSNITVHMFFGNAGMLAIAFITIAAMPVVHSALSREEHEEARIPVLCEKFIERNTELIALYAYFTIGVILGYATLYLVLPESNIALWCNNASCISLQSRSIVFAEQENALRYISQISRGAAKATDIKKVELSEFFYWLSLIFENNFSVLVVAVIFSFIFGAGAIFLITWNASIVGTWIGQAIFASNHFKFFGLLPHGIPEFLGYFLGAIAGGLISIAFTRRKFYTKEIERITIDSFLLIAAAVLSLFIAAVIEAGFKAGFEVFSFALSLAYMLALAVVIMRL